MNRRQFLYALPAIAAGASVLTYTQMETLKHGLIRSLQKDGKYDFNDNLINEDSIDRILGETVVFNSHIDYVFKNQSEILKGRGIARGNHLLTVRHATRVNEIEEAFKSNPGFKIDIKHRLIDGTEIKLIYNDKGNDIGLFELPNKIGMNTAIGNPKELKKGHVIRCICGDSSSDEPLLVKSIVSSNFGSDYLDLGIKVSGITNPPEEYILSTDIFPGCSGGGVYAFRDGVPELVGITQLGSDHIGGILKIDYIMDKLKPFKVE